MQHLLLVSNIAVGENEQNVVCALSALPCHHCDVLDDGLKIRGSVEFDYLEAAGVVCKKPGNPIDLCLQN